MNTHEKNIQRNKNNYNECMIGSRGIVIQHVPIDSISKMRRNMYNHNDASIRGFKEIRRTHQCVCKMGLSF